jgi:hypothetical protein
MVYLNSVWIKKDYRLSILLIVFHKSRIKCNQSFDQFNLLFPLFKISTEVEYDIVWLHLINKILFFPLLYFIETIHDTIHIQVFFLNCIFVSNIIQTWLMWVQKGKRLFLKSCENELLLDIAIEIERLFRHTILFYTRYKQITIRCILNR